eukprot:TRINITY_DN3471_c0_g1_i1.p1 TRINITY_DN3471_c0_g1~~TRINITY_DN3471_c0_g1_i1.p1  ORF type:complete len:114 (+),score=29.29 TRINITY_DN3471_c0_g1_i1:100-441(+)
MTKQNQPDNENTAQESAEEIDKDEKHITDEEMRSFLSSSFSIVESGSRSGRAGNFYQQPQPSPPKTRSNTSLFSQKTTSKTTTTSSTSSKTKSKTSTSKKFIIIIIIIIQQAE